MDNTDSSKLLTTRDGEKVDIPFGGSLALLALGDIGLLLWRQKRDEIIQQKLAERPPQS